MFARVIWPFQVAALVAAIVVVALIPTGERKRGRPGGRPLARLERDRVVEPGGALATAARYDRRAH